MTKGTTGRRFSSFHDMGEALNPATPAETDRAAAARKGWETRRANAAIAVLDEAQFLGRRVRVWRMGWAGDIRIGLASGLDNVPELEVANSNAYALLETLGLDPESVGELPVAELRQRLSDPRIRRRLDADAQLGRYVPTLLAMVAAKPTISELSLAWA